MSGEYGDPAVHEKGNAGVLDKGVVVVLVLCLVVALVGVCWQRQHQPKQALEAVLANPSNAAIRKATRLDADSIGEGDPTVILPLLSTIEIDLLTSGRYAEYNTFSSSWNQVFGTPDAVTKYAAHHLLGFDSVLASDYLQRLVNNGKLQEAYRLSERLALKNRHLAGLPYSLAANFGCAYAEKVWGVVYQGAIFDFLPNDLAPAPISRYNKNHLAQAQYALIHSGKPPKLQTNCLLNPAHT